MFTNLIEKALLPILFMNLYLKVMNKVDSLPFILRTKVSFGTVFFLVLLLEVGGT